MTRRGVGFLALLAFVYLAANYTRVGWLYIIAAGIAALLLLSWVWALLALRGIRVARSVTRPSGQPFLAGETAPGEGDPTRLTLTFHGFRWPRLLVRVTDAAPALAQPLTWLVPSLRPGASLTAQQVWERRGEVQFSTVLLETAAPFGLFRARRVLHVPAVLLVHPRWYPAPDARSAPLIATEAMALPRSGSGGAFLGVREYRSGDPLRAIHWRSSFRRNRLVVKEFEDIAHPALTIALDASRDLGRSPRSSLDDAVRLAASALRWATERGMLVTLAGPDAPRTPVDWRRGMEYLARLTVRPGLDLAAALAAMPPAPAVLVLSPQPGEDARRALARWQRAGATVTLVRFAGYASDEEEDSPDGRGAVLCSPRSDLAVVTALMIAALRQTLPYGGEAR